MKKLFFKVLCLLGFHLFPEWSSPVQRYIAPYHKRNGYHWVAGYSLRICKHCPKLEERKMTKNYIRRHSPIKPRE